MGQRTAKRSQPSSIALGLLSSRPSEFRLISRWYDFLEEMRFICTRRWRTVWLGFAVNDAVIENRFSGHDHVHVFQRDALGQQHGVLRCLRDIRFADTPDEHVFQA